MEDVHCKICKSKADAKISGEASKHPNHWYYTCPNCPNPKGNGALFIKMGNPAIEENPPWKKRKFEPPLRDASAGVNAHPEFNRSLNEKIDLILCKVEELLSYIENSPPQEQRSP